MENSHKNDLIAVSVGISDLKSFVNQRCFTKEDTYRLAYNLTVECFEDIFDPKSHKIGQKINSKNPKNILELQCLVNLVDWQIKNNKKKLHQQFELDRWMQTIKKNKTDKTMLEWRALQS